MPDLRFADCHNDLLLGVASQRDLGNDDLFGQFWLPQLRVGNVHLCVMPVYTEDWFTGEAALRRALTTIETARAMAARHAEDVMLVTTASELRESLGAGRGSRLPLPPRPGVRAPGGHGPRVRRGRIRFLHHHRQRFSLNPEIRSRGLRRD